MEKHPLENLMITSMTALRDMIDVNTIIGDTVETLDGTIIIPVSKVGFGFASGGSEFNSNKFNKYSDFSKLPFGGGSGAGVNITPVAFLIVKDSNIKVMTIESNSPLDKLADATEDIIKKVSNVIERSYLKEKDKIKDVDLRNLGNEEDGR